ncbi:response regulator [Marinagarivorans algicola]|uniref:response regulator n=1 Tax=Marinagarivorans algicola TaxID=1513270 RepID=UPI0006B53279|nr:response regulator [Marinagarivorans algicola]
MKSKNAQAMTILMADDDDDDRLMTQDALAESRVLNDFKYVSDGVELLSYLRREGKYADDIKYPLPSLILLDLNMPRKDGREALMEIKSDKVLRRIPVVILTTSKEQEDKIRGYDLGAASFISKPVSFDGLVELMKALGRYWVEFVEFPVNNSLEG